MHHILKSIKIIGVTKYITNLLHNIYKNRNKLKTEKNIQIQSCKS